MKIEREITRADLTKIALKQVARHRPAVDMTIYPNGTNGHHSPKPSTLLADIKRLQSQTPKDVRILRRRVKRRLPF